MTIDPLFEFEDEVYLKIALFTEYETKGMVVSYEVYPSKSVMYDVRWSNGARGVYWGFELTTSKFVPNGDSDG